MRIASLAPSATIMLQELGAAEEIVACTSICPLPAMERRQKSVGTFSVLNEEKIARARPDLVITATLVQAKGAARLKVAGYNVLHLDPRRLVEIGQTYALLGEEIGKAEQGRALREKFLAELKRLDDGPHYGRLRRPMWGSAKPAVYAEEWHQPPFVAGNWVPDLVAAAGGESVLIAPGEPSREITLEEIQVADPDVIIQHVCLPPAWLVSTAQQSAQRQAQRALFRQQLLARPGWDSLRAVRAGRVYGIEDTPFNMPTQGVLGGVEILREVLAEVGLKSRQAAINDIIFS